MMTGFAVDELIQEALDEGVHTVLYKPFDAGRLLKLVRNIRQSTVVLLVDDDNADRNYPLLPFIGLWILLR